MAIKEKTTISLDAQTKRDGIAILDAMGLNLSTFLSDNWYATGVCHSRQASALHSKKTTRDIPCSKRTWMIPAS